MVNPLVVFFNCSLTWNSSSLIRLLLLLLLLGLFGFLLLLLAEEINKSEEVTKVKLIANGKVDEGQGNKQSNGMVKLIMG